MERTVNIGIELVQDLKIRQRREGEILGVCPVCGCRDANFNVDKLVWRCFDESALITTDNGIIPIKDVAVGMKVLSTGGKFETVVNTFKYWYDGDLISINSKNLTRPINSLPTHTLFKYSDGTIVEEKASNILPGDWLIVPIINDFSDCNLLSSSCLLYTSPSPRDLSTSRMPSSA